MKLILSLSTAMAVLFASSSLVSAASPQNLDTETSAVQQERDVLLAESHSEQDTRGKRRVDHDNDDHEDHDDGYDDHDDHDDDRYDDHDENDHDEDHSDSRDHYKNQKKQYNRNGEEHEKNTKS